MIRWRHEHKRAAARLARRMAATRLVAGALARARKKAVAEGRLIVRVDQSGFYRLPMVVRTWAPCGQTPVLHVPLTHDHLAAISQLPPAEAGSLRVARNEPSARVWPIDGGPAAPKPCRVCLIGGSPSNMLRWQRFLPATPPMFG